MKNYTSTVPVERTVARIEQILAKAGARNIIKDYEGGELQAITFTLPLPGSDRFTPVRLPANRDAVEGVLRRKLIRRPTRETLIRIHEQAGRTAWRLMLDWLEVQLSLIELQQVEALQVFLPYVWIGGQSYYAALKEGGFRMLPQKCGREGD